MSVMKTNRQRMIKTLTIISISFMTYFSVSTSFADTERSKPLNQLLTMDLKQLLNVKITLASRTEESAFSSPAAVYVLTQEDIRRSGHRRLPEILRMIPGFHVGKIDSNKWSISSRNAQNHFASTMLVMIDGRHVYTPLFGGVRWEIQDTLLEDIERIEVVKGPGGPLWGANAVDGIINVITKNSADTQGTLLTATVGTAETESEIGVRYGNNNQKGFNYRVFAKSFNLSAGEHLPGDESTHGGLLKQGSDANDDGNGDLLGFRMDWDINSANSLMLSANTYKNRYNEDRRLSIGIIPNDVDYDGHNITFQWKRHLDNNSKLLVSGFFDRVRIKDDILEETQNIGEIDLQHTIQSGKHTLTWGGGYRHYENDSDIPDPTSCITTACFFLDPDSRQDETYNVFFQDRYQINDSNALIFGSKFEDNDYTGYEYQPTARYLWTPDTSRTLWAAVTRSVRTPTRADFDSNVDFGVFTIRTGDTETDSWSIYTYEVGYRQRLSKQFSFDVSIFKSDFDTQFSFDVTRFKSGFDTTGRDKTYGIELIADWQPLSNWRLEAGYSYHKGRDNPAPGSTDETLVFPQHSIQLRSQLDISESLELDAHLYHSDVRETGAGSSVRLSDYTRLDIRAGFKLSKNVRLSLLGTNLLDDVHAENSTAFKVNTGARRGVMLNATINFD